MMKRTTMICNICNGEMAPYIGPKYNRAMGGFLVLAGAFSTLFWIGPVLGIPLFVMGIYMTSAKRQLWVCKDCNTAIERLEFRQAPSQPRESTAARERKIHGLSDI